MTKGPLPLTLSLVLALTLAACGGSDTGGGGGTGGGGTGGGGGGTGGGGTGGGGTGGGGTGGGTPTPGTNGLNYGQAGQSLSDAEAIAIIAKAAGLQAGATPTGGTATVTLDAGFFTGNGLPSSLDGTVQIYGQTVTITNGVGALSSGEEVRLTFEPNRAGTYSAAVDATITNGTGGTINGETVFVTGFETDPSVIGARTSGGLVYTGDFQATGSLNGAANTATPYEGGIRIDVDFTGAGNADVSLDGQLNSTTSVDLGANNLALSGNSFEGGLSCTVGCSINGTSRVDGTFYGPDADEVGGTLRVNLLVGGETFVGIGSFIVTDPVAN